MQKKLDLLVDLFHTTCSVPTLTIDIKLGLHHTLNYYCALCIFSCVLKPDKIGC